jgi:hypothetical protein
MSCRPVPAIAVGSCLLVLTSVPDALAHSSFQPDSADTRHYPEHARAQEQPHLDARRADDSTIKVDGRLDDEVWRDAPSGWGFLEMDPDRGRIASEETVFKVAYDNDAIYFGVACFERDPSATSSILCRRDEMRNSDMVSVYVDPFHDYTTGYNFRVNPDGVQEDYYVFNDGNRDKDWNAVWSAETSRDDNGWYAEIRIPFSAMRYRPQESMTWGLQVYRYMHGRGEDTGWASWERNASGFVSRFGELRGLRDVPAPRQLEVLPYTVARTTDPAVAGPSDEPDNFANFGADMKYGVTANLSLNATFQPDFGQVEADPAVLNLGPFETFFQERRPFFVEGAQAFEHPDFNLFYSRRIGTGTENTRIRAAGKLTGKTAGNFNVAALIAATDETQPGMAHNPFRSGSDQTWYGVGRFGKEFDDGNHRFNLMQTVVMRDSGLRETPDDDPLRSRDAYSSGADFEMNFDERTYQLRGSVVTTMIQNAPIASVPGSQEDLDVGTGGNLRAGKYGGNWRGSVGGRWESERLDPNDIGLLFASDEYSTNAWVQRRLDPAEGSYLTNGSINLNFHQSWLFAGREFADPASPGTALWSYDPWNAQSSGFNINGWGQNRHRWSMWWGVWHDFRGTSKYATRFFDGVRGPLMRTARSDGFWWGINSDWRKDMVAELNLEGNWNEYGRSYYRVSVGGRWVQSMRLNHSIDVGFSDSHDDAQWMNNFAATAGVPEIGNVSYVFGELDNKTLDLTLRSNVLFSRNQSLEVYAQPFLTTGTYSNARGLAQADTRDLQPYAAVDFDASDSDFRFASLNANFVYRWEYLPGSTIFLVWTHSRGQWEDRAGAQNPNTFDPSFTRGLLFTNEPTNTFLVKLSYWFSI